MQTAQPLDINELIRSAGLQVKWVAEQLGLRAATLYQGRWSSGNLNPLEIDRLAEVLRLPREQVEAAVRESARRHAGAKAAPAPVAQPKGGAA